MTIIEMYLEPTGDTCAGCGGEVLVGDLGGTEVVLECDCGPAAAAA